MRIPGLARPNITRSQLQVLWPDLKYFVQPFILGIRGYASIGREEKNGRGSYDDAIIVIGPEGEFFTFNGNTDPSDIKPGRAVLVPGVYQYQIGIHNRNATEPRKHKALVQAAPVTILRDGSNIPEKGFFGINIHRGGKLTTGSLGCQTIQSDQWQEFIDVVSFDIMERYSMRYIYYKLVEAPPGVEDLKKP